MAAPLVMIQAGAVGCGGSLTTGLSGRVSNANPNIDRRLVSLLKEYVDNWVNYDKAKLFAAFGKLQKEYGIKEANFVEMNSNLMDKYGVFWTWLGHNKYALHEIEFQKEYIIQAHGTDMGKISAVMLGNTLLSTHPETQGKGGEYELKKSKRKIFFLPYQFIREEYGGGIDSAILLEHGVYHEFSHGVFGFEGHLEGEKAAELFALSAGVNEHVTDIDKIFSYYSKRRSNPTYGKGLIMKKVITIQKNTNLGGARVKIENEMNNLYNQLRRKDSSLPWSINDAPNEAIAPIAYKLFFDHLVKHYGGTYRFKELTNHMPIPKTAK